MNPTALHPPSPAPPRTTAPPGHVGYIDHLAIQRVPPTGRQRWPRNTVEVHLRDGRRYRLCGERDLPGYSRVYWQVLSRYGVRLRWDRPERGVRRAWSEIVCDGIERGCARGRRAAG